MRACERSPARTATKSRLTQLCYTHDDEGIARELNRRKLVPCRGEGFTAGIVRKLRGRYGRTISALRPSGTTEFDGRRIDTLQVQRQAQPE